MTDQPDSPAELKARALRHLVRREHSRAELARKLAPHAGSAVALEQVLDFLVERKSQSDLRYAEERARVLSRKYGPARIRHELRAKGIARPRQRARSARSAHASCRAAASPARSSCAWF